MFNKFICVLFGSFDLFGLFGSFGTMVNWFILFIWYNGKLVYFVYLVHWFILFIWYTGLFWFKWYTGSFVLLRIFGSFGTMVNWFILFFGTMVDLV